MVLQCIDFMARLLEFGYRFYPYYLCDFGPVVHIFFSFFFSSKPGILIIHIVLVLRLNELYVKYLERFWYTISYMIIIFNWPRDLNMIN